MKKFVLTIMLVLSLMVVGCEKYQGQDVGGLGMNYDLSVSTYVVLHHEMCMHHSLLPSLVGLEMPNI